MRIQELTAWHVRIPLRKEIKHASHTRTENDTLVVRCRLADGTVGWGEGLPRPYVTGETIESAIGQLRDTDFAELSNASLGSPDDVLSCCDQLNIHNEASDARQRFGNSVRCAVELSTLDAACRFLKVPLSDVTTWLPETQPIRHSIKRVRYSGAITSGSKGKQRHQAMKMRVFGFHQTKVKVGTDGIDDRELLRRVRRIVGSKMDVRVDANEAWTPENVVQQIQNLDGFNITCFEQPVPADDVACLADARRATSANIMLDESLCSIKDGRDAIAGHWCDYFNIRLSKCGGFLRSLRLAAMAHAAGLGYQLGCQVGETGILSAAGRHFAASVSEIRYLEGSYDRFLIRDALTKEDLTFGFRGFAPVLTKPGLGITVNEQSIEARAVESLSWAFSDAE